MKSSELELEAIEKQNEICKNLTQIREALDFFGKIIEEELMKSWETELKLELRAEQELRVTAKSLS